MTLVARAACLALCVIAALPAAARATTPLLPDFEDRELATGLDSPVAAAWAPDGRIFVAEHRGVVRVVQGGQLLTQPLIDISDHVNNAGDRGIVGIAVDSDFSTNHYLYIWYVHSAPGDDSFADQSSRLTRVVVRPDNTVADPSSPETVIVGRDSDGPCPEPSNEVDCVPSDYISHTVGTVRADADGTLWLGTGDSAIAGADDQRAFWAQDPQSYAGKIIHVDREGHGVPGHQFCPDDDDLTHVCTKIHASGFRNPFRFTLRGSGLGPIVGDVGFNAWEELDLTVAGRNYGWPCWEGPEHMSQWEPDPKCQALYAAGTTTGPDYAYPGNHGSTGGGESIVGGPLYTAGDYPDQFDGRIFIGDWSHAAIATLHKVNGAFVREDFAHAVNPTDIQIAPSGNVAYVDPESFQPGAGRVAELVYCPVNCSPVARATADKQSGPVPLTVAFKGDTSTDPDGDVLTYDWDFGDGSPHSALPNPTHEYTTAGVRLAKLTVTDPGGKTGVASIPVSAGNSAPAPSVDAPSATFRYDAGTPVKLSGSATDPEDGVVDGSDLEWQVILHHGNHIHPFGEFSGATAEFTPAIDHDVDSFYEIRLTARDSAGLTGSTTLELHPRAVALTLESSPAGAPLAYGGASVIAPHTRDAAVGHVVSLSAAATFQSNGHTYAFERWSDGGAAQHDITVPGAPATLRAEYRALPDEQPPPPEGGPEPVPDLAGPALTFDIERAATGRRVLGQATDASGVKSVEVALRVRRISGQGCRWWLSGAGRLAHSLTRCAQPRWIRAKLTGPPTSVDWRAPLGHALPGGGYELLVRATDERGNVTRLANGSSRAGFTVRR